MIPKRLRPVSLPLRPGSRSSTVRRNSLRSLPTPDSWSIARTGRSRKRFDMPAAVAISLRPMPVIWSTFLPNSGEAASSAISSATKPSTFSSSADFFSLSIATRPAAFSGTTIGTGSGGVSSSSVAVLVVVWVVVAIRCPLPAGLYCIRQARHGVQGRHRRRRERAASRYPAEGQIAPRARQPPTRSGEDAGDRVDFDGVDGERVGKQHRRHDERGEGGGNVLRVVRKSGHWSSPLVLSGGSSADAGSFARPVPVRGNGGFAL